MDLFFVNAARIMEIIKRRRAAADDRQGFKAAAGQIEDAQIDWCIREEYDALIAEIEASGDGVVQET